MNTHRFEMVVLAVLAFQAAEPGLALPPPSNPQEEAALVKRAEAFVEAFHKGDAWALAGFWTPQGDYTDQAGRQFKGREAIEKAFQSLFAENKGLKLQIASDSLRFVTPEVALEDGTTAVIPADGGPPSRVRYSAIHVKKDSQWFLESVRDAPFAPPTNHEHLRGLEWIIGNWSDDTDKGEIAQASFAWTENQNFIVSSYATTFKNIAVSSGTQWIGWDPLARQIRSWTFDANGSFGEGTWTREGDRLIIKTQMILQDGRKIAATNIVTRINADTLGWQSRDRRVDGKELPDIKEIKMKRRG
jgi:uncharacterized protein (TIGR02246 family)